MENKYRHEKESQYTHMLSIHFDRAHIRQASERFFCAYSESTNYMKQKQPSYNRNFIPELAKAHQMQLTLYIVCVLTAFASFNYWLQNKIFSYK